MSAACPDIPIIVLPKNNVLRGGTRLPGTVETARLTAITALTLLRAELLSPDGGEGTAGVSMDAAVDTVSRLAIEAMVTPMDAASLQPIVPNHEYFGVRTASIDDTYLVSEVTTIVARALIDLRTARVNLNDQAAEIRAMIEILKNLVSGDGGSAPRSARDSAGCGAQYVPGRDELTRWVITHHLYFVLNLAAADAVSRAVAALAEADRDAALAALQQATVYVHGFTAAMVHSGDMSAPCYNAKVRPTMQPPAVRTALTGRTQPEHRAFRKAMQNLVRVSPEPFAKLAAEDPELALARDALLEADLHDIERHIVVTAALVGDGFSIVRGEESSESAIAVLRMMRHTRAMAYCDLMKFGDPVGRSAREH